MGLFSRKNKVDENKKVDDKSAKVDNSKKHEDKKSMKELYSAKVKKVKDVKSQAVEDGPKKRTEIIRKHSRAYKILIKPLVTEKASSVGIENKYIFQVAKKANKIEIAKAIQEVYGVKPINVNTIRVKGKRTRYGKIQGKRKDWKKAIIKLPEGKSIKIYEGV